jgi:4-hydroxybenzoate polyprenyltransferase
MQPITRFIEDLRSESVGKLKALIRLMRPTQWIKNTFVFAGLLFNQSFSDPELLMSVFLAFCSFCMIASAIYAINDIRDVEQDRESEAKKHRPIASGAVTSKEGVFLAAVLFSVGLTIGYMSSQLVALILVAYFVINLGYSYGLKRIVILDVFIIASGFLLRILAGTVGVGMEPSEWLFLCSVCLTLFLGFGKRRAELSSNKEGGSELGRSVLRDYSPTLLDSMMASAAASTFVTYGLFTMSDATAEQHGTRALVYTLPLVMYAMFRYFYMLHGNGKGNDPSEDLVRDPHIIISALLWLLATYLIIR